MAAFGSGASEEHQGVVDGLPIVLVLVAGIGAPLASWFATRRARSPGIWFGLGALTGPIALALLAVAPPGRCPTCDARTDGWPTVCRRCGTRYRDGEPRRSHVAEPEDVARPTPIGGPTTVAAPKVLSTAHRRESRDTQPTPIGSARTAIRRESSATWPGRQMVSPMALGVRPSFTASNRAAATDRHDVSASEVLSTGVYISGNAGLEIGACYGIMRDGENMRVIGPVDAGELTIRYEGPIVDVDITAMDDRVIISGRQGRSPLAIVFRTIGGMRAADLEQALAGPIAGLRS